MRYQRLSDGVSNVIAHLIRSISPSERYYLRSQGYYLHYGEAGFQLDLNICSTVLHGFSQSTAVAHYVQPLQNCNR